jgi:hypothetical protein
VLIAAPTPLVLGTPLEDHLDTLGLLVKREDLSCPPPGPPFSKTRGVLAHVKARFDEGVRVFGALDTYHSQAGHAVAHACRLLGAQCVNYFPVYKAEIEAGGFGEGDTIVLKEGYRPPQQRSSELGAVLFALPAGRSAVLYHQAKKDCLARGGYMMPNALKLPETLEETAAEVVRTFEQADREQFEVLRSSPWLISCSSATIASGVMAGLADCGLLSRDGYARRVRVILHMGYKRSVPAVLDYIDERFTTARRRPLDVGDIHYDRSDFIAEVVDEGYAYADQARAGVDPSWPCNPYYDLKAFRWWMREGRAKYGRAVMWNIG